MFDDKDIPANLPIGSASPFPNVGEVPRGVRGDGSVPPSMTPSNPPLAGGGTTVPLDMFEPVDGGVSAPSSLALDHQPEAPHKSGGALKVILIVVGAFVLLALIGWGAFALLGAAESDTPTSLPSSQTPSNSPLSGGGTEPAEPTSPSSPVDDQPSTPAPVEEPDGDGDGLTDAEEARYGTAIHKPDTDNDGLFDREEVMVYRTNPLSADTDGDGFLDGSEVSNGYNPNGPGRLLELPTSKD